jgi:hypothetical protein
MPFPFKKRHPTAADIATRVRSMSMLQIFLQDNGGRAKLSMITGRPRRAVDSWFVGRSIPPEVCVMLDQVRGVREAGFTLATLAPEVLQWPDAIQSLEFLPLLPVISLRADVQDLLRAYPQYTPPPIAAEAIATVHFTPPSDFTLPQVYEAQLRVREALRTGTLTGCTPLDMWLATRRRTLTFEQAYPQSPSVAPPSVSLAHRAIQDAQPLDDSEPESVLDYTTTDLPDL